MKYYLHVFIWLWLKWKFKVNVKYVVNPVCNIEDPNMKHVIIWPDPVPEHVTPCDESQTKAIIPQEAKTDWTRFSASYELLQSDNRKCPLS